MRYRVIIQTEDKKGFKKEEWNKTEDTIDDCLDVLKDWIPNVIGRKDIINIQVLKEE